MARLGVLRNHARAIWKAALAAADPVQAVERHVSVHDGVLFAGRKRYQLSRFGRVFVIGAGKASAAMAAPLERLLGDRIRGGLINVKYGHTVRLKRIDINECGHPVPDEAGLRGASQIAAMVRQAGEGDLLICLISGGASALLPAPAPGITLSAKQRITKQLLASGATIHEINAVRKHLSYLKGGQLAKLAYPATVLTLLLSDVIGDNLDVIGSGPTAPDSSTFAAARAVLKKYRLLDRVPASIRNRISDGVAGKIPETPKPGDLHLSRTENLIVGSNRLAIDAAKAKARALGYHPLVLSTSIEGETRDVAAVHAAIAREIRQSGNPVPSPACVISGGETTVTVRGKGKGGRNQEFVLAAAIGIQGLRDAVIASLGTDGTDGPTDAAGAVADSSTIERARSSGLDPAKFLSENDSYNFFKRLGDLILTGPTNTNVMDVRIVLVGA